MAMPLGCLHVTLDSSFIQNPQEVGPEVPIGESCFGLYGASVTNHPIRTAETMELEVESTFPALDDRQQSAADFITY